VHVTWCRDALQANGKTPICLPPPALPVNTLGFLQPMVQPWPPPICLRCHNRRRPVTVLLAAAAAHSPADRIKRLSGCNLSTLCMDHTQPCPSHASMPHLMNCQPPPLRRLVTWHALGLGAFALSTSTKKTPAQAGAPSLNPYHRTPPETCLQATAYNSSSSSSCR
jgi:hypothetical protein